MIYKDEIEVAQAIFRIYPEAKRIMSQRREYWYGICGGGDPGSEHVDGGEKTLQQDKYIACLEGDKAIKTAEQVVWAVEIAMEKLTKAERSVIAYVLYDSSRFDKAARLLDKSPSYVRITFRAAIAKSIPLLLHVYQHARDIRSRYCAKQRPVHSDKELSPCPY